MEKHIFLDIEEAENGCMSILIQDQQVVFAGKSINSLTDRDSHQSVYQIFAETFGIYFCQANTVQDYNFYPVPMVEIFATDGHGGCYASVGGGGNLDDGDEFPIVHISPQQDVISMGQGMRSFFSLCTYFPYWKAYLENPTNDMINHLEQAYQFLHPALERHRRLLSGLFCLERSVESLQTLRTNALPVTLYPSRQAAEKENAFLNVKHNPS